MLIDSAQDEPDDGKVEEDGRKGIYNADQGPLRLRISNTSPIRSGGQ